MEIHVTARIRNGAMVRALRARGFTQADLSKASGVSVSTISMIICMRYDLKRFPKSAQAPCVQRVADALYLDPEDIVNPSLLGQAFESRHETFVEADLAQLTEARQHLYLGSPQVLEVIQDEEAELLHEAISKLTFRESQVLHARFGLKGSAPETLVELSRRLGVSIERVRMIQEKGIRRLRCNGDFERLIQADLEEV